MAAWAQVFFAIKFSPPSQQNKAMRISEAVQHQVSPGEDASGAGGGGDSTYASRTDRAAAIRLLPVGPGRSDR